MRGSTASTTGSGCAAGAARSFGSRQLAVIHTSWSGMATISTFVDRHASTSTRRRSKVINGITGKTLHGEEVIKHWCDSMDDAIETLEVRG